MEVMCDAGALLHVAHVYASTVNDEVNVYGFFPFFLIYGNKEIPNLTKQSRSGIIPPT